MMLVVAGIVAILALIILTFGFYWFLEKKETMEYLILFIFHVGITMFVSLFILLYYIYGDVGISFILSIGIGAIVVPVPVLILIRRVGEDFELVSHRGDTAEIEKTDITKKEIMKKELIRAPAIWVFIFFLALYIGLKTGDFYWVYFTIPTQIIISGILTYIEIKRGEILGI